MKVRQDSSHPFIDVGLLGSDVDADVQEIKDSFVFPEWFGAKGDGVTDDTLAFQAAIDHCAENGIELQGYSGHSYLITDQLDIPYAYPLSFNGNECNIIVGANINAVFYIGANTTNRDYDAGRQKPALHHFNVKYDGTHNATYLIDIKPGVKDYEFYNIYSENTINGLRLGDGTGIIPGDFQIHDCIFYGNGLEYDGCGIIVNLTDSEAYNLRIYGFQRCFDINGYIRIFNVHGLIRWHDQTVDNFFPVVPGSAEWNEYWPKTCFANILTTAGSHILDNCYSDGLHTFVKFSVSNASVMVTNLYFLGATHADAGGSCVFDLSPISGTYKTAAIQIADSALYFASTDHSSYGFYLDGGYISRESRVYIKNVRINGYSKLANAADPILSGNPIERSKYIAFTANTWYVIGAVGNIPNNFRMTFHIVSGGTPIDIEVNIQNGAVNYVKYLGLNDPSSVTIGFWYSQTYKALFICEKLTSNATTAVWFKVDGTVPGGGFPFELLPAYAANPAQTDPYAYSLPLSDLTTDTPGTATIQYPLSSLTPVGAVVASTTYPANSTTNVSLTFNTTKAVDRGVFMLNQTVGGLGITAAHSISKTGCQLRVTNTSSSPITVALTVVGLVWKG